MKYDFSIIPAKVISICNKIEEAGFEAYVVGGAVRDICMGRVPNDYDITTSASPQEIAQIFGHQKDSHILDIGGSVEHGVSFVMYENEQFEIATFRTDGAYNGHQCEVSFGVTLIEDLQRRDFTINAMAYRPFTNELKCVDGAEDDMQNSTLRTVGKTIERFTEDPLRIMRAFRFQSQLGFKIAPEIIDASKLLVNSITLCSWERINKEFTKTICGDFFETAITSMFKCGIMDIIMPEFRAIWECKQENPHHYLSVGGHTFKVMENVPNTPLMRYAALFHDFGKPQTKIMDDKGVCHFPNHPYASEVLAKTILNRFRFDNDFVSKVCTLVQYHDAKFVTEKSIRKFISKYGEELLHNELKLRRADVLGQHPTYQFKEKMGEVDFASELVNKVINDIHSKNQTLTKNALAIRGGDLIAMGYQKGPLIGELVNKMFDFVLEFPEKNTKEDLVVFLNSLD